MLLLAFVEKCNIFLLNSIEIIKAANYFNVY